MQINNLTINLGKPSDINCEDEQQFENYTMNTLNKIDLAQLGNEFTNVYNTVVNKYSNWDSDYLKYCDGKIALAKFINDFANELEVHKSRVEKYIDRLIQNDKNVSMKLQKYLQEFVNILISFFFI